MDNFELVTRKSSADDWMAVPGAGILREDEIPALFDDFMRWAVPHGGELDGYPVWITLMKSPNPSGPQFTVMFGVRKIVAPETSAG